jgi:type VI secretion system protein VasJ
MLTVEQVKSDVEPWLRPISPAAPAGDNAMYDPRYEELRAKMVALDSPTGGDVEWPDIVRSGRELLTGATKDLLIASYTVYAMVETDGLRGLSVGLELVRGLLDTYWDTMFPPAARPRGRGNAVDWLVARLELTLPRLDIGPADRPSVELVSTQWKELSTIARDRLGEHCPAMRGVEDVLTRILMSLPAPAPPPPAPAAPVPDPAVAGAPAPPPSVAAEASPPPPTPAEPTAQPAAAAPSTVEPATSGTPAATAPADRLAAAREVAKAWLLPIEGDFPAGADPRYEQLYQDARNEVIKLDTPTGEQPDLGIVAGASDTILRTKGKDVLIAGYLAFARFEDKGLPELPACLLLVSGLVEDFSDTMFPTRPRGRTNALTWFIEQLDRALAPVKPKAEQRDLVLDIEAATKELMTVLRDKLGDDAPGMSPLRDRVQRLVLAVPQKKPDPPPPPPRPTQPTPAAAPAAGTAPMARPAGDMPQATDVGSVEEVSKFLLATGQALVKAAGMLRRADDGSASAYRLLRCGLWLHLVAPPPADAGGKTSVPGLPAPRRAQFETILSNAKWSAAIEELESALQQFRFCLDLNRMTHQALVALGPSHEAAATAVVSETASLLRRMPTLLDLCAADGTRFADDATRSWIAQTLLAGSESGGTGSSTDDGAEREAIAELRTLMKTQPQEGMKLGKKIIDEATSPRSRLLRRLGLAEACLEADQARLARGMFAAIDREMRDRGLQDWDPPLVGRCLDGFMRSIRAAAKAGSPYAGADEIFERLCLVDPAAAARLSG